MDTPSTIMPLQCVVVTPERAVLDEKCDFVALPMYDGELGVMPGRRPLIGRLGFGELRTVNGRHTQRFYVDGGFVQVRDNVVTVLTSKAIRAEDIKVAAAHAALGAPTKAVTTEEGIEANLKAQEQARAQLRVVRHHEQASGHGGAAH